MLEDCSPLEDKKPVFKNAFFSGHLEGGWAQPDPKAVRCLGERPGRHQAVLPCRRQRTQDVLCQQGALNLRKVSQALKSVDYLVELVSTLFRQLYWLEAESKEKIWCMGPYHGVDYNLTLMFTPESTPTHLPWDWAMGNPIPEAYARVDFIPQSGTLDLASVVA